MTTFWTLHNQKGHFAHSLLARNEMTTFPTDSQMAQITKIFTEKITNIYVQAYKKNLLSLKSREVFVPFNTEPPGTSVWSGNTQSLLLKEIIAQSGWLTREQRRGIRSKVPEAPLKNTEKNWDPGFPGAGKK